MTPVRLEPVAPRSRVHDGDAHDGGDDYDDSM